MTFAGVNYLAILAAAVAAWAFGAAYYSGLAKPWMAAAERTEADLKKYEGSLRLYLPFGVSFVAELVMAWTLAGLLAHLGQATLRGGVISAFFVWLGFVLPTIATNYAYGDRKPMLIALDTAHWLGVLLIIGAIVGAWGVQ